METKNMENMRIEVFDPNNYYNMNQCAEYLDWTPVQIKTSQLIQNKRIKVKSKYYILKEDLHEIKKELDHRKKIAIKPDWRKPKAPEPILLDGYDTIKNYAIKKGISYFIMTAAIQKANLEHKMLNFNTKQYKQNEMENAYNLYMATRNDSRKKNIDQLNRIRNEKSRY